MDEAGSSSNMADVRVDRFGRRRGADAPGCRRALCVAAKSLRQTSTA